MIALGIIGIVSAMTLPSFITNIRENVRKEQVRNVKYKLTQATDKMKSMGLLIESYPNTIDFVNELKKHYKIIKVCDNQHLTECWPTKKISTVDGDINVST
ncbi:MAG: type II secretion system protein, partial [Clostridia bacterium]|nr:type II secretion system protein [Clostridia bacterium]